MIQLNPERLENLCAIKILSKLSRMEDVDRLRLPDSIKIIFQMCYPNDVKLSRCDAFKFKSFGM